MTRSLPAAVGVDIGTTNTKVVVVELGNADGSGPGVVRELRRHSVPTPTDAAALRDAVLRAIATVVAGGDERIDAVGIASMAESGALLDPDGEPRGGLLRWNDERSGDIDALVSDVGAAALYASTGVPVPAKTPLAHWLRLRRDEDARLTAVRWCGAADLIAHALTGVLATDHTLAARTMLYRSVPLHTDLPRAFDPDLLELGGLTAEQVPAVVEPGSAAGTITAAAAAFTGLPAGVPVYIAGHDHAVGAWAAGARWDGDAADSVGTAEALFRVSATPIPRDPAGQAGMSIARTVDGAHESLLAGNPTAGALVEWAFRALFPGADREATLASASLAATGWAGEPLVLPYLRGRQAPAPDRRAVFRVVDRTGATASLPADPGEALAALLAGLVLHLAWLDSAQNDVVGATRASSPAARLRVLGGPGAANDAWWTFKRALLPGSLCRVTATEPVATGAALLALHRLTGADTVLPAETAATDLPGPPAAAEAAALLADFIAAATHPQQKEDR